MTAERKQIVVGWLEKAESDLAYAKLGLDNGDYYFAGAVYHCQQAAEKALKALCCFHGVKPPKTHDLVTLLEKLKGLRMIRGCLISPSGPVFTKLGLRRRRGISLLRKSNAPNSTGAWMIWSRTPGTTCLGQT